MRFQPRPGQRLDASSCDWNGPEPDNLPSVSLDWQDWYGAVEKVFYKCRDSLNNYASLQQDALVILQNRSVKRKRVFLAAGNLTYSWGFPGRMFCCIAAISPNAMGSSGSTPIVSKRWPGSKAHEVADGIGERQDLGDHATLGAAYSLALNPLLRPSRGGVASTMAYSISAHPSRPRGNGRTQRLI